MTIKRKPYVVEIKKGKRWAFHTNSNDEDYAKINADVVSRSRGIAARVKYNKKVIYEVNPDIIELLKGKGLI